MTRPLTIHDIIGIRTLRHLLCEILFYVREVISKQDLHIYTEQYQAHFAIKQDQLFKHVERWGESFAYFSGGDLQKSSSQKL